MNTPTDLLNTVQLPIITNKVKAPLPEHILCYARSLRKNQTDAEHLIWFLLRGRRFADKKFRRQYPIGNFILDFYCHEIKLAVELDGGQHNEDMNDHYDTARTEWLKQQGIHVVRYWNHDVLQRTEIVLQSLWDEIHNRF